MSTTEEPQPLPRDELVVMVTRAHQDSAYGDSTLAGRTLAAQSKLPKLIAENLGAGFGQWDFFPEPSDIVDFALAYAAPADEEELWTLARAWAEDDAGGRRTILALVGREIMQHELKRIDVPKLKELFAETRASRALSLRVSLGLAVPEATGPKGASKKKSVAAPRAAATGGAPAPAAPAAPKRPIPTTMPKPEFKRPPPKAAAPPARKFQHPKFGEGLLESQEGEGPDAKLTIKFAVGSKTLLARYVTESA